MLSPYAVHIPLAAMSAKAEKYRKKARATGQKLPHPIYAAMIEHTDDMVGRIVDAIEAEGLTSKTMIIFTSDNGGLHKRYDYRAAADDLVAEPATGGLKLKVTLPSGVYATVLLREVLGLES